MHFGIDDEPGGGEGIGEHPVEGEIPGPWRAFVRHEDHHRLAGPLQKLDFCHSWPHTFDVAGEGIREEILAGPV